jgi:hypothetical protein
VKDTKNSIKKLKKIGLKSKAKSISTSLKSTAKSALGSVGSTKSSMRTNLGTSTTGYKPGKLSTTVDASVKEVKETLSDKLKARKPITQKSIDETMMRQPVDRSKGMDSSDEKGNYFKSESLKKRLEKRKGK